MEVEPGIPEQFCTSAEKLGDAPLAVAPYPVAWRVEVVDTDKHRGFGYVRSGLYSMQWSGPLTLHHRFCWGSSNWAWSLAGASKDNGAKVRGLRLMRTMIEKFQYSGVALARSYVYPCTDVETDPSEGRKHVHIFAVTARRIGFPSVI